MSNDYPDDSVNDGFPEHVFSRVCKNCRFEHLTVSTIIFPRDVFVRFVCKSCGSLQAEYCYSLRTKKGTLDPFLTETLM